jgi:DNA polymerase III epsilon subunit-like protein
MKHLMIDLETLGTTPGCVILSIGAVYFDSNGSLGDEFYKVIHRASCVEAGLHEDPDTLAWWNRQSVEACQVLRDAELDGGATLAKVLSEFSDFCKRDTKVKAWGNGADFDNAILNVAYKAVNVKQGYTAYSGRCYRTVKNLFKGPKLERVGTYHNALDDAKSQALHLMEIMRAHPQADWS